MICNSQIEMKFCAVYSLLLAVISFTHQSCCGQSPQCVDENGRNVDWYVLYKLPQIYSKKYPVRFTSQGAAYLYITSKTVTAGKWKLGKFPITSAESIPGKTLKPIFEEKTKNENYFWTFYNDQPPNDNYRAGEGHTKGIVAGDIKGGFWLIHSVPHFPQISVQSFEYKYPATGKKYGQSFLCISMNAANIEHVGELELALKECLTTYEVRSHPRRQLIVNSAYVFNKFFNDHLMEKYPMLFRAAQNERDKVDRSKQLIQSSNKRRFVSFAKSKNFKKDIYADWVSDVLGTELSVESWLHHVPLPSNCHVPYPVYNIVELKVTADSTPVSFRAWNDHSKYAVSTNERKPWVCIGDINRAVTQRFRGGGVVCMKTKKLWSAYQSMISEVKPCV